ncbi:hypothetical protein [Mesorhizobium australicum]|uniref:Flagellar FliJ protein n=1 Tax=Mesorhizobium australicum TaxID=536018 RepID=A0A1X7PKF6_9HYPH|nr:hypothetical protein [Mesorhizobium australicum]SMH52137.1 hypothetical protein SAMN02982922_4611 [Mesorhizobium australicum]
MTNRSDRLKQIVKLQKKVTEIHEMRRANFLAQAAAAEREAKEILEARNEGSMSNLFPDVYSRFVEKAVARARDNEALAQAEGLKVAAETARTNIVERTWREALRDEERKAEERAALDAVEQRLALK